MGLTNLTYGLYGGVVAYAIPQLLSLRHVPEPSISALTEIAFTPGFWAFLFSPALDVRFSRRGYAVALALFSAATLVVAFLNLDNLLLLDWVLTLGFFAAYLYQSAIGGWLSSITSDDEERTLSVWITVANVGGFALMAIFCNQIVGRFSPLVAAIVLGGSILLPLLAFPFMQAPGPDRRLASESFGQFFNDLWTLVRRREILIALVLFAAPAGTFSLTNFLGSRGEDFHASARFVGLIGGVGVGIGGVVGCLVFPWLARFAKFRPLYLTVGLVGSLMTLGLSLLPHTPLSFAIVLVGENVLQSLAITISMAIIFETIGRNNPLAATTFCFVGSAYGVPIWYMLKVDTLGFKHGGVSGSLVFDAVAGIVASLALFGMLKLVGRGPTANAAHGARTICG
jgi:PAT family beta-lactamase induction signal transducer AmpG